MAQKIWIGIDNGKHGGLCAISEDNQVVKKMIMPLIDGKDYDVQEVVSFLSAYEPQLVVLEKVFAMPKIPRGTALSLGHCLGLMEGVCAALQMPYQIASPKEWQKKVFKGTDYKKNTKAASIKTAKQLCPKEDWTKSERASKDHDGMTDAYCLALYGKMLYS